MKNRVYKIIDFVLTLVIISGLVYFFKNPLWQTYLRLENKFVPCSRPITYSVGNFDKRFNFSQKDFVSALSQAENIWEKASGKNLFEFEQVTSGTLVVNLVYDYRQEATQRLQKLGVTLEDSQQSYDALKKKHSSLLDAYNKQNAELGAMIKIFFFFLVGRRKKNSMP
ncbi:MAG: hypothetical protein NTU97_03595 [Candidatus Magasanikbacteria bacterium]|nr:hypothetical protein [Candidatus Magasanikbacteria bacterium]